MEGAKPTRRTFVPPGAVSIFFLGIIAIILLGTDFQIILETTSVNTSILSHLSGFELAVVSRSWFSQVGGSFYLELWILTIAAALTMILGLALLALDLMEGNPVSVRYQMRRMSHAVSVLGALMFLMSVLCITHLLSAAADEIIIPYVGTMTAVPSIGAPLEALAAALVVWQASRLEKV